MSVQYALTPAPSIPSERTLAVQHNHDVLGFANRLARNNSTNTWGRMKVIALLVVFVSIAGIVLAQDNGASGDATSVKTNNAKVDKSGTLLARCRKDGVTVAQCCKDLGKKDAKLYKGTDGMCCSKCAWDVATTSR